MLPEIPLTKLYKLIYTVGLILLIYYFRCCIMHIKIYSLTENISMMNRVVFWHSHIMMLFRNFVMWRYGVTRSTTARQSNGHYIDVIMSAITSQVTSVSMLCSTVCSGADQRKLQSSASLAFVWGIHRWPVNSPHKRPVALKIFSFDDVIMDMSYLAISYEPYGTYCEHFKEKYH